MLNTVDTGIWVITIIGCIPSSGKYNNSWSLIVIYSLFYGSHQYQFFFLLTYRYLFTLKSYTRNKAQLDGSIIEWHIAEECLIFCLRYLNDVETRLNWPPEELWWKNYWGCQSNYIEWPTMKTNALLYVVQPWISHELCRVAVLFLMHFFQYVSIDLS